MPKSKGQRETDLFDWRADSENRLDFIRVLVASIGAAQEEDVKRALLKSIRLEHYETLAESMSAGTTSACVVIANLIRDLAALECEIGRGPNINLEGPSPLGKLGTSIPIANSGERQRFFLVLINQAMEGEFRPEVRAPLLDALEIITRLANLARCA